MKISPQASTGIAAINIVSCLAVVFLHSCNGFVPWADTGRYDANLAAQVIFRFGVPCFLMITGATLFTFTESYGMKVYAKKRFLKIFIPFLIWSELFIVWHLALGWQQWKGWKTLVAPILTNTANPIYWYFYAVFGIYAFIPLVSLALEGRDQVFRNRLVIFLAVVFYAINRVLPFARAHGLPVSYEFNPPFGNGYFVYCCLGYLLFANKLAAKLRYVIYAVGIIAVPAFIVYTRAENVAAHANKNTFFQYDSLPGILCAVPIFVAGLYAPWDRISDALRHRLRSWSSLSYGIYLAHIAVMFYVDGLLTRMRMNPLAAYLLPVRAIVTFVVSAIIVWLLKKIPVLGRYLIP